jgi:hypothetical protein
MHLDALNGPTSHSSSCCLGKYDMNARTRPQIKNHCRISYSTFGKLTNLIAMTSEIQKHIEQHNADYVKSFSHGKLARSPAKKYLVGRFPRHWMPSYHPANRNRRKGEQMTKQFVRQ